MDSVGPCPLVARYGSARSTSSPPNETWHPGICGEHTFTAECGPLSSTRPASHRRGACSARSPPRSPAWAGTPRASREPRPRCRAAPRPSGTRRGPTAAHRVRRSLAARSECSPSTNWVLGRASRTSVQDAAETVPGPSDTPKNWAPTPRRHPRFREVGGTCDAHERTPVRRCVRSCR